MITRRTLALLLVVIASFSIAVTAAAQDDEEFEIEFDNDELPPANHPLTPSLFYGAELELELDSELNYDLDYEDNESEVNLEPYFKVRFAYIPSPRFDAGLSFELARELLLEREPDESSPPTRLELKEAFVRFRSLADGLSVTLGRQSFDDEREWLYDEELDAVRLFYAVRNLGLEASVSREALFQTDLLNNNDQERINNVVLLGRYMPDDDLVFEGYAFRRDELEPGGGQPTFLGLRSFGEATPDIDYWAELAYVTGKGERDEALGGRPDLQGYGLDVGATYVFDSPTEPSLTLGFAHGSGDEDVTDGADGNFRQTGLHDNSDRFNGVASFSYYGEAFEPELSNLSILTAGAGIKPTERSSVDLVYHRYWQDEAVDDIRDSNLDEDPGGEHRSLGSETDLIVGYRPLSNWAMEAILGWFKPGDAFDDDDDNAFFVGFETIFQF